MGSIQFTILNVLLKLIEILTWAIVIKSLMTWFPGGRQSKIYDFLDTLTYPIENPIRNLMYKYTNGPIDFSPMIAILVLIVIERIIISIFI
ncbi:YggT family protein [Clostridioides mangenotii]|uniref:YggT family protein n=1 Tax=Metaclostridioides mangenotii TaxID=1540 RepID=UPI001C112C88|nr:YggT family protein [Clostridioides mangenotii]MBU5306706.1 YggT family protein [Clostridioides mangenotii]MCR1955242.1 YggT family protein [Clostridioides mangenotii]